jgi:hypothetical protein
VERVHDGEVRNVGAAARDTVTTQARTLDPGQAAGRVQPPSR